jgi:hypothetical protein
MLVWQEALCCMKPRGKDGDSDLGNKAVASTTPEMGASQVRERYGMLWTVRINAG